MKNKNSSRNYHLSIHNSQLERGFTLIELVITITVLSVLALATIPLMQNAVRRQKEQLLRERLREIRLAIDEFKRDTNGVCSTNQTQIATAGFVAAPDPRQRVMISDCKIFEADNLDRFPPTLDILVEGVEVTPRNGNAQTQGGSVFGGKNATELGSVTQPKKKVYLREVPVDPITGEKFDCKQGNCRSPYQQKDSTDWDGISVFDVRSTAEGETLDGVKYGDL